MSQANAQQATVAVLSLSLLVSLWPAAPFGVWLGTGIAALLGLTGSVLSARTDLAAQVKPTSKRIAQGLIGGLAMAAATHLVYPWAVALVPSVAAEAGALYTRLDAPPGKLMALPIVAAVVLAEELVFRGLAYGQLRKRFPMAPAIALSVLLYAVPQVASGSWLLPLLAIGCGLVWTLQRAISGNLVVPTLTHFVWDLMVMVLFPLDVGQPMAG